jgi:hypothetical protein
LIQFLAAGVFCRYDNRGPSDSLFDFRRVNAMPGNMAYVVQIPIESIQSVERNHKYIPFPYLQIRNCPSSRLQSQRLATERVKALGRRF